MRKSNEQIVIDHVCRYGRFLDCKNNTQAKYGVRYNGKFYAADDTRALVKKIMDAEHPRSVCND